MYIYIYIYGPSIFFGTPPALGGVPKNRLGALFTGGNLFVSQRVTAGERSPLWCHGPAEELTGRGSTFEVEMVSAFRCDATAPRRGSQDESLTTDRLPLESVMWSSHSC